MDVTDVRSLRRVASSGRYHAASTPGEITSIRSRATPRRTRSSRVLSEMAWKAARRYTRGSGCSAAHTTAATGQLASANAVVPKRCGTMATNGRRVRVGID